MPKVHNIGPAFVQLTNFPYKWGNKFVVRGWTQEIDEPFRTSKPLIVRLPNYKALVLGLWSEEQDEETALSGALERREVTENDFTEEAGWTPASDSNRETSSNDLDPRFDHMDGAVNVYLRKTFDSVAKAAD
jgi:hypothetical protein